MPSRTGGARPDRLEQGLRVATLAVPLALSCLTGLLTTYAILLLALLALPVVLIRQGSIPVDPAGKMFAAAFLAIAALFAISADGPVDVLLAFNFVAFLAYAPLAALLARGAAPGNAETVARLALAGAAIGCAVSVVEVYVLGAARAGTFATDTIRLGDTAVLLGFLSLIGVVQARGKARWPYLLGPILAAVVVLLTGARGAMIAFPIMVSAALILLIRNKSIAVATGVGAPLLLAGAAVTGLFGSARLASIMGFVADITAGEPIRDDAIRIRVELYKAGWEAFQQSPFTGHGWARLMSSVEPFLADADKQHAQLPHLHNELLNFAVFGGLAGVAVYLVLIAAPIVLTLRSARDSQYGARRFGILMLTAGYVAMGLPDTMLSFELHTALYVVLVAILLAYCRDAPGQAPTRAAAAAAR